MAGQTVTRNDQADSADAKKSQELKEAERQLARQIGPAVFLNVISGAMLFSGRAALAGTIFPTAGSVSIFLTRCASAGALVEFLINPICGKLTDSWGRKAVMPLGNISTFLFRILVFLRPNEAWPMVVEQLVTVPLTTSFFTTWRAAVSDVLEGTAYAQFQAKMGMAAGLGVIIGPLLGKVIMAKLHVKYCFLASSVVSSCALVHMGLNFKETLPLEKRKPLQNVFGEMQPLSFLKVMKQSNALNRLMWVTGLQTATEGRNITDLVNVYLAQDLKWDWGSINNFVGAFGVALVVSGAGAKGMVAKLGLRKFTFVSNTANFLGQVLFANPAPLNLLLSSSAAMWLGMVASAPGGRKRDAAEALIMSLGSEAGFGRGFLSGAMNNWRALVNIVCPLLFGWFYARMSKVGRAGNVFLLASMSLVAAELVFRRLSDKELGLDEHGRFKNENGKAKVSA